MASASTARSNPRDTPHNPEDGTLNPEDSSRIPKKRRPYHLSEEGRAHLSNLGSSRWAGQAEADQREAELSQREKRVQEVEEIPVEERLRRVVRREIVSLPEVTVETVLRCDGRDYRLSKDGLVHVYFPQGEKIEFEDSAPFRFEGRAYCIKNRALAHVPASSIFGRVLGKEG
jgi:hypothetical protein